MLCDLVPLKSSATDLCIDRDMLHISCILRRGTDVCCGLAGLSVLYLATRTDRIACLCMVCDQCNQSCPHTQNDLALMGLQHHSMVVRLLLAFLRISGFIFLSRALSMW